MGGWVWRGVVIITNTITNNIYRGFLSKLKPSNASNSSFEAVKFPQKRQVRQMRQMEAETFERGAELRLSEYGLWFLYPGAWNERMRDRMRARRFIVVGWSRDGACTRLITVGGSPKYQHSYHNSFLERVCPKG